MSDLRAPGRLGLTIVAAGAFLLLAGVAQAASFDCKKAATAIEQLICGDPELDAFDSQLDGAYRGALDRSADPAAVKERQLTWIKKRNACADAACLLTAYKRQIPLLTAISDPPPICVNAVNTIEGNACEAEKSRRADRELTRYVAAARKRLTAEAAGEFAEPSAKAALAQLDASQTAWEAYRKAECSAVHTWFSTGTIRGIMHEDCWRSVTQARTVTVWTNWLQHLDDTPPLMPEPAVR